MTTDARALVVSALGEGLRPEPRISPADWAARHRIMSQGPLAGQRWDPAQTPYAAGIMEAMSPHSRWRRVAVMKGAQIVGTQTILNFIGSVIHHAPAPILVVHPSAQAGEDWSKDDLAPLVEMTPELRARVADPKGRSSDNTITRKVFPGGWILVRGANSPVGLRRFSVRYVVLDDVDGFPLDAGGEGDPAALAEQRANVYGARAKIILVSTPTLKESSRIEPAFLAGTQSRFYVPCPECGQMQSLDWTRADGSKGLVWPSGRPREAAYACIGCGSLIPEWHKPRMFLAGAWRDGAAGDGQTWSCHLSSLYTPLGRQNSWGHIAEQWCEAQGNPLRLQAVVNTMLGETWRETTGESVDTAALLARVETWGERVPERVGIITAGVDVQDNRLEVEVVGWGLDEESWSLEYWRLDGDPTSAALWAELDALLLRERPREGGGSLEVLACAVDSGHEHEAVYRFCQARAARRVWAVKGDDGPRPIWPTAAPKRRRGAPFKPYIVGVDSAKSQIMGRLALPAPGRGYMHLGPHNSTEWIEQIKAEYRKRVPTRDGHLRWKWTLPPHKRNEALDCRVYAYAALHGLYFRGRSIERELAAVREAAQLAAARPGAPTAPAPSPAVAPPPAPPRVPPRPGWMSARR